MKRLLGLIVIVLLLSACAFSENLFVRKVENLSEDFILGMDSSCVPALENSGVVYRDYSGEPADVFTVLRDSGINCIRVRVWNDPFDSNGNGYGGGNCDIKNAVEIGKRATACGMKLIVSFHYSDFWADTSKQMCPKAWKGMKIQEKTQAAYEYTYECLNMLLEAGVDVCMVAVGNETNNKLAGEKTWFNIQYIMQAGAKATREVYPDALVAMHFANPENAESYANYASKMDYYSVDYDVFATSYYPFWHGSLQNLSEVLSGISDTYGKRVMVMETSYAYTEKDSDFFGNTISDGSSIEKSYPFTVQGQANSVRAITDTLVNHTKNAIGLCYWEGTWIAVGTDSWQENHEKWEKYGSGWATSYARSYDPNDAGRYFGGCAVDNQALFDEYGYPLESLKVFEYMRSGHETEISVNAVEDINLIIDINSDIVLPGTVNAVMADDSKQQIPVTWFLSDETKKLMRTGGVAKYEITGNAGGMTAHCYVNMVEYNYISDYSFEDGGIGWVLTDLSKADQLYVEDKKSDSLTGTKHFHFWSAARNSVEFTLEQSVTGLTSGSYRFTISIMGGDCGTQDIYCYVKVDGDIVAQAPMVITSFGNWDTVAAPEFVYNAGSDIKVGVYVRCEGSGNGAWGKIDDALLNTVRR